MECAVFNPNCTSNSSVHLGWETTFELREFADLFFSVVAMPNWRRLLENSQTQAPRSVSTTNQLGGTPHHSGIPDVVVVNFSVLKTQVWRCQSRANLSPGKNSVNREIFREFEREIEGILDSRAVKASYGAISQVLLFCAPTRNRERIRGAIREITRRNRARG